MLATALGFLIDVVFGLFTYTLLLRLVMQLMRAPFRNPLGQSVMALTDWIVKPLRKVLPGIVWKSGVTAKPQLVPPEVLAQCRELGATLAAGLAAGIY